MGKTKKSTNNKGNKSNCYVLLSRVGADDDVDSKPKEVVELSEVKVVEVKETTTPTLNLTSFEQIRDATMESNELIKEIIYNVRMLRQEVAELTEHVTNRGSKN